MCEARIGRVPAVKFFAILAIIGLVVGPFTTAAGNDGAALAFDDKFTIRLTSYTIDNADTSLLVADSETGLGVAYSFKNDLGGDDDTTVPRIDMTYRFNDRHRVDFATFKADRSGRQLLQIEVELADQTFAIGDTLVSDIEYEVYRLAYGYSFYRSEQVELSVTAGFHVTTYEFEYQLSGERKADSADATGPLPMFGLQASYAMTPKWALHYHTESFYFEFDDTYRGSFVTNELNLEYRFNKYLAVGVGVTRFATDLKTDDSDWKGSISDSHRGWLGYASFFL